MSNSQKEMIGRLNLDMSLQDMQEHVRKILPLRGLAGQPVQNSLLLLCEEVGELAKAIRKNTRGMSYDAKGEGKDSVESELADIMIILADIANTLNISMAEAFITKEKINAERSWNKI